MIDHGMNPPNNDTRAHAHALVLRLPRSEHKATNAAVGAMIR